METDRSGLVAAYVGQTALKVHQAVDRATHGVLFVDEAYALADGDSSAAHRYGAEAVAALVKLMEDRSDRLCVVAAGYPREMKRFLEMNPGLASRFNHHLHFEAYTPDELLAIFDSFCAQRGFHAEEGARARLRGLLAGLSDRREEDVGNARLVRNLFEEAVRNQASRLAGQPGGREELTLLRAADIPSRRPRRRPPGAWACARARLGWRSAGLMPRSLAGRARPRVGRWRGAALGCRSSCQGASAAGSTAGVGIRSWRLCDAVVAGGVSGICGRCSEG